VTSSRKNCRRLSKLSACHRRLIEIAVRCSPTKTFNQLKRELADGGTEVRASTIRRYLKKLGFVPICFTEATADSIRHHRNLRLDFARKYVNKPIEFWCHVLFTDETRIAIRYDTINTRVRRKMGEQFNFLSSAVKHPLAVMMWGYFVANGVGCVWFPEKHETCNTA